MKKRTGKTDFRWYVFLFDRKFVKTPIKSISCIQCTLSCIMEYVINNEMFW